MRVSLLTAQKMPGRLILLLRAMANASAQGTTAFSRPQAQKWAQRKKRKQESKGNERRENVLYRTLFSCCRNYRRYNRFFHHGLLKFCMLQYIEFLSGYLFFVFAYLVEQAGNPSGRRSELAPRDILWLTVLTHFPVSTDIKEPDFKHIHCKVALSD